MSLKSYIYGCIVCTLIFYGLVIIFILVFVEVELDVMSPLRQIPNYSVGMAIKY